MRILIRTACILLMSVCLCGCSSEEPTPPADTDQIAITPKAMADAIAQPKSNPATATNGQTDSATSANSNEPAPIGVLADLQGKWIITDAHINGTAMNEMRGSVAEITGSTIVVIVGGQQMKSTMVFEEGTDPIRFESVSINGQRGLAIMELHDNELTVATRSDPESGHPKSFEPGPGQIVIKYKRG